jgi:hypothetical protein
MHNHLKHVMPSMGAALRRLIARRFLTLLLDEYRSSKGCNSCAARNKKTDVGYYRITNYHTGQERNDTQRLVS